MKKEIKDLLIVLNSTKGFKYPIGNKVLMEKVKDLEEKGLIKYDTIYQVWKKMI